MLLDKKKHVIVPLLDELRKYNSSIGRYEKSMITESFDYSVKLSNGLIRLPEELVDDYEKSPGGITLDRIKAVAFKFNPSIETMTLPSSTGELRVKKPVKAKRRTIVFAASIVILVILITLITIFLFNRTKQLDKENVARINQELRDSEKTARLNQKRLDSANTARLNQEKIDSANTVAEAAKTLVRNRIRTYVTANCTYTYKLIGSITNLKITVANNTDYTMDAVKVRAAYLKQQGGVYKYEELNFVSLLPHTQTTLNGPDSDRGTHIQIGIETISSNQLGL